MALIDGLTSQWLTNNNGDDSIGPHDMFSVSPSGYTIDAHLGSHALIYDSFDDKSIISDHADFSFGDGVSDSPFTFAHWIKMTDASTFRLFSKGINASNIEYIITLNSLDQILFNLYDQTTANFLSQVSTVGFTLKQGSYLLVAGSYTGNASTSGMKLYAGDSTSMKRLPTTPSSGGSYTAMHPGLGDLWLGGSQFGGFADGLIDTSYVWNRALSDGGVAEDNTVGVGSDMDLLWNGGLGIEISAAIAAGRRRRMLLKGA